MLYSKENDTNYKLMMIQIEGLTKELNSLISNRYNGNPHAFMFNEFEFLLFVIKSLTDIIKKFNEVMSNL